jgi:hypothetical protein
MALSDILTVPFLISLGITLFLIGIIGFFFVQRLQEQNHKITSMFGLVTTMAEEMNFMRSRLQMMSYQGPASSNIVSKQPFSNLAEENLIPVSDDEEDEDDEDDVESDYDDEEDDSDDEQSEDEDDDNLLEPEIIELSHESNGGVKVINFAEILQSTDEPEDNDNNSEELGELDEIEDLDDDSVESDSPNSEFNFDSGSGSGSNINTSDLEFIKKIEIDITNLEESVESNNIDYKKMSLNRIKKIALAKGLISENSKATKNTILKLLGCE